MTVCMSGRQIRVTTVWPSVINRTLRVAIVGAGASGLTTAKALLEVGIEPTVYEASARVGGLWAAGDGAPTGNPSYASLITNTSKHITAFSDFPFPDAFPDFPTRKDVNTYLDSYVRAFGLHTHIRFGSLVQHVRPIGTEWEVATAVGRELETYRFDAVLVASGIFRQAAKPRLLGLKYFKGQTFHSLDYERSEPFAGRRVVVVGMGSSAVDIATDLVGVAKRVIMSVRRAAWVAPRMADGRPLDHRGTRASSWMPAADRARRRRKRVASEYQRRGWPDIGSVWGQSSVPFSLDSAPSVTSDLLIPAVMSDDIRLAPAISQIEAHTIRITNGDTYEADDIILCTGYDFGFPYLSPDLLPWRSDRDGLYRLIVSPEHPGLGFIGVCRAHGPILPIVEMQARWAARVLIGEVQLPDAVTMRREIDGRVARQRTITDSPIRVSLLPYLDSLSAEFGACPAVWRHPTLMRPLLFGPPAAAQYRLNGPDSWDGAAKVLRS